MGIFDKFRKKKEEKVAQDIPKSSGIASADSGRPRNDRVKGSTARAHQILMRPVLSEKGTHLASRGEYVFVVAPRANKPEIRKAIEAVYDVHVRSVAVQKMPGKERHYGRSVGRTSAFKKAHVKLRAGEKIPGIVEAVG